MSSTRRQHGPCTWATFRARSTVPRSTTGSKNLVKYSRSTSRSRTTPSFSLSTSNLWLMRFGMLMERCVLIRWFINFSTPNSVARKLRFYFYILARYSSWLNDVYLVKLRLHQNRNLPITIQLSAQHQPFSNLIGYNINRKYVPFLHHARKKIIYINNIDFSII